MNPRQRRGVLLVLVTIVGALVTFAAVFSYVSSVESQVGPMIRVLELSTDVAELQAITDENVTEVEIPERWAPETAVRSVTDLEGMVASGTYSAGSIVQTGMLENPPGLAQGYREVAILVDAETGVAGKVKPGDHVDILATVRNDQTGEQTSQVVIDNALVIEVGVVVTTEEEDSSGNFQEGEKVPVTFALSSEQALQLTYAESFAVKVRLALRGEGDDAASGTQVYTFPNGQGMPDVTTGD